MFTIGRECPVHCKRHLADRRSQATDDTGSGDIKRLRAFGCALLSALALLWSVEAAAASFSIVYDTPRSQDEKNARAFIVDEGVTQTISKLLNDEFQLRSDLSLLLGGTRGPMFDAASNEIRMPYSFVFDVADRFNHDSYSRTGMDIYDVTRDAYLYALLHEVCHALFAMYGLRTSGDMEKAVDAMTIVLLLKYYQGGGSIIINAAELFVDEGGSPRGSFWSQHEFDQQSYDQAVCLVYGSDPGRYAELRNRSDFLQARARECIREYRRQIDVWFQVLGAFLKRPPPE